MRGLKGLALLMLLTSAPLIAAASGEKPQWLKISVRDGSQTLEGEIVLFGTISGKHMDIQQPAVKVGDKFYEILFFQVPNPNWGQQITQNNNIAGFTINLCRFYGFQNSQMPSFIMFPFRGLQRGFSGVVEMTAPSEKEIVAIVDNNPQRSAANYYQLFSYSCSGRFRF